LASFQGFAGNSLSYLADTGFLILFAALLIDRFDSQEWLTRTVGHPVVWFGKAIEVVDWHFNLESVPAIQRRRNGFISIFVLMLAVGVFGWLLQILLRSWWLAGWLVEAFIVSVMLAQRSLADHVSAVAHALKTEGLAAGRIEVSKIVGRDPDQLDEPGVCRAAIESLAENSSDGVVAPAFWYAMGGLPGLFAYKLLNTADSMIGHMSERHLDFGRFAARLDDMANWIPARLTGLLIIAAGFIRSGYEIARGAWVVMLRDARSHRSPNAGWPEAAMAGVLDLCLGGPRRYGELTVNEPVLNGAGRRTANPSDIRLALDRFWLSMVLLYLLTIFPVIL
jgi:adenosylcobinamide-phosphate synthase